MCCCKVVTYKRDSKSQGWTLPIFSDTKMWGDRADASL